MFNKKQKNNVVIINTITKESQIGKDMNCTICGKIFSKYNTLDEVSKHVEKCQRNRKKNDIENLLKDLKEANDEIEKIEELRKNFKVLKKKSTTIKSETIFDSMIKKSKKRDTEEFNINKIDIEFLKALPFEEKLEYFKKYLNSLKIDWREGSQTLNLDRDNFLKQSIVQLNDINLYKELKINFSGEISHDAGGLIREWYTIIFKSILSSDLLFFEKADTDDFSFCINQKINANIENLDTFYFIGRIIAKALLDNITVNTCFNKLIYKMILNEKIILEDLIFINKPLYHSLRQLDKIDNIEDLGLYFMIESEKNGEIQKDELIQNGSNISVNNLNYREYISKRLDYIQLKDKIFIQEIRAGIYSIIPEKIIKIFNSDELELLINGQPFIDLYDWIENTSYKGYDRNCQLISNFWSIMENLSQDQLSRFLQFCTGSSRVPLGGFSVMESNRGTISRFCITRVNFTDGGKNYIKAHTCFNRLDMPEFPNKKLLEESVNFIIENEILGFGID